MENDERGKVESLRSLLLRDGCQAPVLTEPERQAIKVVEGILARQETPREVRARRHMEELIYGCWLTGDAYAPEPAQAQGNDQGKRDMAGIAGLNAGQRQPNERINRQVEGLLTISTWLLSADQPPATGGLSLVEMYAQILKRLIKSTVFAQPGTSELLALFESLMPKIDSYDLHWNRHYGSNFAKDARQDTHPDGNAQE